MVDGDVPNEEQATRRRTASSFAYEWEHFGALRPEWERNFLDYFKPHAPSWFAGRNVLDVGAGSGRHSLQAFRLGAHVAAVDVGDAIEVARRNLPADVLTVQADAERLPFAESAFDLVAAIGVLHHLPDPERALRGLFRYVRPGGYVHIYLYWLPRQRWQRGVLQLVTAARIVTTRLPHAVLRLLSYPVAAAAFAVFVLPHRVLRRSALGRRIALNLPLGTYADYPFGVCVNDQFDRFSAPLERRFEKQEVQRLLLDAGFVNVVVRDNYGWVGSGRRPS
jgi:2-polyprenyl-3-methyl-5-hydroxy-6-metoxy-1,4-benzoquinol methylase